MKKNSTETTRREAEPAVDLNAFKRAMGSFPSGVVIATTLDGEGRPWGFTASSFSSVSLEPPLVLVCPAKTADCYVPFATARVFSINILRSEDEAVARLFATSGADKFVGDRFLTGAYGLPVLRDSVASLVCRRFADYECGDHLVLVGQVESLRLGSTADAIVYYRRRYWRFARSDGLQPSVADKRPRRRGSRG